MRPHHVCPIDDCCRSGCQGTFEAIVMRNAKNFADRRLAREADKDRDLESAQAAQISQQEEVVPPRLRKTESWIDNEFAPLDAGERRVFDQAAKIRQDLTSDVNAAYERPAMDQNERRLRLGDHCQHLRIGDSGYVVDEHGPGASCLPRHTSFASVDRNQSSGVSGACYGG